jgi:CDP-paratose 2-epimerase
LSSSRVYPYDRLNQESFIEEKSRFRFLVEPHSKLTKKGISESYTLVGIRSLYGASKLSAELIINEYCNMYRLGAIINRCGVVAGPWQFGKVDQGVITHWVMAHHLKRPLKYIGYGGQGKQVRDILHIEDLFDVVDLQITNFDQCNGATYNIGGGLGVSTSLLELTDICRVVTGNYVDISSTAVDRVADLRIYITDSSFFENLLGWRPKKDVYSIVFDINKWLNENSKNLKSILSLM